MGSGETTLQEIMNLAADRSWNSMQIEEIHYYDCHDCDHMAF